MLARLGLARALGALLFVSGSSAFAQRAEAVDTTPARSVEIVVVGSEGDFDAVRSTIGQNAFDGATVRWSRAPRLETAELLAKRPEASELGVRAWIDLTDEKNAALYFADRAGERFLVRSLALPDGLTPLGREALGQILELSVRALLEDDRIGMTRAETTELLKAHAPEPEKQPPAPDVPPEPEAPAARSSESSLGAEAFYAAHLYSGEMSLVHGPGLGLGWITESSKTRSLVWVTGEYELPRHYAVPEVSVEWSTVRVQGGVGLSFLVGDSSFLAGGRLGAGAEFTSFSPSPGSGSESVVLEPSGVSTAPVVSASLEGSVPLGSRLGASARLGASFYPLRVHYDVARGAEVETVLAPYRVRPGVELGLHLR